MSTEPNDYVVRWEVPIRATSPRAAALEAQRIMAEERDQNTYFEVFPGEPSETEAVVVNLDEVDEDGLVCCVCNDMVPQTDLRAHLAEHTPHAYDFDPEQIRDAFWAR